MNIRAHHLWVLRGVLERYGEVSHIAVYSSLEERQRWKEIYKTLCKNLDSKVVIVDCLDDVCMKCLNSDGTKCMKYPRLDDVDNQAIGEFGLEYGKEYTSKEIITKLAPRKFARLAHRQQ